MKKSDVQKVDGSLLWQYALSQTKFGDRLKPFEHEVVAAMTAKDYNPNASKNRAARTLGKSRWTVYRALKRIQVKLADDYARI